jgi:hypothetical protein
MKNLLQYRYLIPVTLFLGLAPFYPQPHIVEKIGMLSAGTLTGSTDIFDLFWHSWPFALLVYRISIDIKERMH